MKRRSDGSIIEDPYIKDGPMVKSMRNREGILPMADGGISKVWLPARTTQPREGQLWRGAVCTFPVAPLTSSGQNLEEPLDRVTYGLLRLGQRFEDWRLDVHNIPMITQ